MVRLGKIKYDINFKLYRWQFCRNAIDSLINTQGDFVKEYRAIDLFIINDI